MFPLPVNKFARRFSILHFIFCVSMDTGLETGLHPFAHFWNQFLSPIWKSISPCSNPPTFTPSPPVQFPPPPHENPFAQCAFHPKIDFCVWIQLWFTKVIRQAIKECFPLNWVNWLINWMKMESAETGSNYGNLLRLSFGDEKFCINNQRTLSLTIKSKRLDLSFSLSLISFIWILRFMPEKWPYISRTVLSCSNFVIFSSMIWVCEPDRNSSNSMRDTSRTSFPLIEKAFSHLIVKFPI